MSEPAPTTPDDSRARGPSPTAGRTVLLTVPADTDVLALVRLNAAMLGAFANFTVDEVDDMRIAVDEAVAHVASLEGASEIHLRFEVGPTSLVIEVDRGATDRAEPLSDLALIVLQATTDEFTDEHRDGHYRFRMVKHHAAEL
jgi:serine/threonine-protein kinase RsbW